MRFAILVIPIAVEAPGAVKLLFQKLLQGFDVFASRPGIRLFVYGTLKKGFRNHDRFCSNAISIEPATVNGKLYDTGWGFPAMQLSDDLDDIVHGEIVTLPEAALPAIDRLEGIPRLYQRVEAIAVSEAGTKSTTYCYVMEHLPPGAIRREGWGA